MIRYLTAGGLTFLTDAGTLFVGHGVLGLPIWLATAIAFTVAVIVDFALQRLLTFAAHGARGSAIPGQSLRFGSLIAANFLVTQALMGALTSRALGVDYLVAKVLTAAMIAVYDYFLYRYWVFRGPARPEADETAAEVVGAA